MIKKILISILLILFVSSSALAVGTCNYYGQVGQKGRYKWYYWSVTTDANGDMTETGSGCTSEAISGYLIQVEFWPDATNPWTDTTADVQLRGTNTNPAYNTDYDYTHGTGADLDSSITDADNIRAPITTDSTYIALHGTKLTPWVDEAGDTKTGIIFVLIKDFEESN